MVAVKETEVLTELSSASNWFRINFLGSPNGKTPPIKEKKVWALMIMTD